MSNPSDPGAETAFFFLSGNGNDFIALTSPTPQPAPENVAGWCRRGASLGADGVLHLERTPAGRVRLLYWNADGGRSDFCFNGTRAAAQLASHLGWCETGTVEIETDAGSFVASIINDSEVEIDAPIPPTPKPVELEALAPVGGVLERALAGSCAYALKVGVPHLVLVLELGQTPEALAQLEVVTIGARLRRHPLFPDGTNVNFVCFSRARDRFAIRTYERGVEAETLACGSGVVASAWVGVHSERLRLPATVTTRGGFAMQLAGVSTPGTLPKHWRLRGDARVVASGRLCPGALGTR